MAKSFVLVPALVLAVLLGYVGDAAAAYAGTQTGKLQYVHLKSNVASSQALMIKLVNSPDLCTSQQIDHAIMKDSDALFDSVVQLLLTAISTQLNVKVYTTYTNGACQIAQIRLLNN